MDIDTNTEFFFWKDITTKTKRTLQKTLVMLPLGSGPRVDRGHFSIFTFCTIEKFPT